MGFVGVEGMEKLLKARDNSPKNRLVRWQKAVTALPLLVGLKEMEKLGIGRGLVYSYVEHSSVIYTPLSKRPDSWFFPLTGSHSLHALAMMHCDGCLRNIVVLGPEADAIDALMPSLKTKTSINALPCGLNRIDQDDHFGLLMQSRAHALRWRKEMLANLKDYMGADHLSEYVSKGLTPDSLRKLALARKPSTGQDVDVPWVLKRLQDACDAYALAYMLYCGGRLISDEMASSMFCLCRLGESRVKRFDKLLGDFRTSCVHAHTNQPAHDNLPQATEVFVKKMADLIGHSLEGEIRRVLANV